MGTRCTRRIAEDLEAPGARRHPRVDRGVEVLPAEDVYDFLVRKLGIELNRLAQDYGHNE